MSRARDADRAGVYAAENHVVTMIDRETPVKFYGSMLDLQADVKFGRVEDIQRWVSVAWTQCGGVGAPPQVRERRGMRRAHYENWGHVIAIPDTPWARRGMVVGHELAHALVGGGGEPSHGELWQKTFINVVRETISPEVALLLQDGFTDVLLA